MSFGVLTLATPNDYLKAIGLALSLRISNPGVPVAVACSPKVRLLVEPYFDHVIDEDPSLRGFVHKVHLDRYTPFDETMFFDSDVLVFRPIRLFIEQWGDAPYIACGAYQTGGISSFGLDRKKVAGKIGKDSLVVIDGAGHALFRKPDCLDVFGMARTVTANYRNYAGDIKYADEDVMNIVMTMMDLSPAPHGEFFSRYLSAKPGTMRMDVTKGHCEFVAFTTGRKFSPCMMHFAANEAPLAYGFQLWRLFRHFGVPTNGLVKLALSDVYDRQIKTPLHNSINRWRLRTVWPVH
jgi:hypothetical protein